MLYLSLFFSQFNSQLTDFDRPLTFPRSPLTSSTRKVLTPTLEDFS